MRVLLQRVSSATVSVDGRVLASIGRGVLLLTGFGRHDGNVDVARAAGRVVDLRIFPGADGKLQHTLAEVGGGVLAVPQFTLYARTDRGRRPDFTEAMAPAEARVMFDAFVAQIRARHDDVGAGVFGADMAVSLVNDGPLTLSLEFQ